ncbi:hypothetical protein I79_010993 [Cricetulus griseus]|uniref:Uncharacterized protein n=1 Tax=Cricetulus griseus TaxID=10029 RepID=G3HJZ0_CRIGR|nr:hypothetical protein I79_010993 [Cricetulus griseus]
MKHSQFVPHQPKQGAELVRATHGCKASNDVKSGSESVNKSSRYLQKSISAQLK